MGFRSTFVSSHLYCPWPDWFREKYAGMVHFPVNDIGPIASSAGGKLYGVFQDLAEDVQRVIAGGECGKRIVLCFLHECGGITRCEVGVEGISWTDPSGWIKVQPGGEHWYCYGCSSPERAE